MLFKGEGEQRWSEEGWRERKGGKGGVGGACTNPPQWMPL